MEVDRNVAVGPAERYNGTYQARACRACAQAKTKCLFDSPQSRTCSRCTRLEKECVPPVAQGRKNPRTSTPSSNRVSQLERKVDNLVNLLSSQQRLGSATSGTEIPTSDQLSVTSSPSSSSIGSQRFDRSGVVDQRTSLQGAHGLHQTASRPTSAINSATGHAAALSPTQTRWDYSEAESLLDVYRNHLSGHFPFVKVPQGTIQEVQNAKPLLLKALMMAACFRNRPRQKQMGDELTRDLVTRLFIDGEKSLDLLQALMIHIAWYHCHLTIHSQMSNLLQLSVAVLADLGLNKPFHPNDRRTIIFDQHKPTYGFATGSDSRNEEQIHAFAGCFYLSSVISSQFRRVDALKYDWYLEDSCKSLLNTNNSDSNVLLVNLVKLHSIVEKIGRTLPYGEPDGSWKYATPVSLHIEALEKNLQDFEANLPQEVQQLGFLALHIRVAKIYIYEIGLFDLPWQHFEAQETQTRIDTLYSCLNACKSFFDIFLNLPNTELFTLPYAMWAQLAYSLLISSRLSLLDCHGWNLDIVRNTLNYSSLLNRISGKLEDANRFAKDKWLYYDKDDLIERVATRIRRIQAWYQNQLQGRRTQITPDPNTMGSATSQTQNGAIADDDDPFWEEFMWRLDESFNSRTRY